MNHLKKGENTPNKASGDIFHSLICAVSSQKTVPGFTRTSVAWWVPGIQLGTEPGTLLWRLNLGQTQCGREEREMKMDIK